MTIHNVFVRSFPFLCPPFRVISCLSWFLPALFLAPLPVAAQDKPLDFAHDVVPILRKHCGKCHTGAKKEGALSMNTRALLLIGGENGPVVMSGKSGASELIKRITSKDEAVQMPPEGPRLTADEVSVLKRWIDGGLTWQEGFAFQGSGYEPPLKPRRPELPPPVNGRTNPVDRILDADLTERKAPQPRPIGDAEFLRRASLDLVGLLPTPEQRAKFLGDSRPDKRTLLVKELLEGDVAYAEHWLTFWNDLLRNDYTGTGFITGGRKQITKWLYEALVTNKPYDQFARELIAPPTPDSAGFIEGIKWRGEVSAGQTVEIQFAQSIGQSLLGINLKCASCHDSFIDRWKLSEAYGLAAIYATEPLSMHRCDKPTGDTAQAAWLFPELGQIDAKAAQPERLKQLAALMTHPENGRFTRTIVNRLWHRLLGRGIVHPVDAMQSEPWSADLLDYLAVHLADSGYNLKATLELIATSQAYQSHSQVLPQAADESEYVYGGPRARRLTAEQFLDAVWQLSGAGPTRFDAAVLRGKPDPSAAAQLKLTGQWIWNKANTRDSAAGETLAFRKQFELKAAPQQALAVIACDNSYTLFVNGQKVQAGDNWEAPDATVVTERLKAGANELLVVAKNGGSGPNAAGLFCEVRIGGADGTDGTYGTDGSWEWNSKLPNANGRFPRGEPTDWQPAAVVEHAHVWSKLDGPLAALLARGASGADLMVRAALVKSDFLMRTLGRPNRDQIVTVRPAELTTLEAIDLANGQILADTLQRGAQKLAARDWQSPEAFIRWLYQFALTREPSAEELILWKESLGDRVTAQGIEDALWMVLMLPEFQLNR